MCSAQIIKPEITLSIVAELIDEQFPEWANLQIKPIEFSGNDNRTFRLGEEMIVRLPSALGYIEQVEKEQKWLPILAPYLSLTIPQPIAKGYPSKNYPWNWSIYKWIEGNNANISSITNEQLKQIALDLARFLNELHKIDITNAPIPGLHNYWRGAHLSVYDIETRKAVAKLRGILNTEVLTSVWEIAKSSKWDKNSVWVHGDLTSENILIKDQQLTAVIDFGCLGIGDPACDLVIAWTFFKTESRKIFKKALCLDQETWNRAMGWAVWKALITLLSIQDKNSPKAMKQLYVINEILNDYN
jgi:aminoglycoside phosphotransferase (APT) family kinase protein